MRQAMSALQMLKSPLQSPAPIEKTVRPSAGRVRLMAFVVDRRSEASLNSGFSQLSISGATIKRGGIARAIQYLSTKRSPETIIVDITGTDMPASKAHQLAELCEPGVTVIAIGERNDVGLYRDLVQAGVTEYIIKPVTAQLLAKALSAPALAEGSRISRKLGKLVSVVGARGGVGATTLAINLAWYLANHQNRRVLLLDLDLQNGDCALALNLTPTPGLREALVNPLRIDSLFLERTVAIHGDRLFVLSAEEPLCADAEFTAEAVETLVAVLRTQFHYIIADVPRIPAAPYRQALDIAEIRVIVADQTLRSVRDTVRLHDALGKGNPARSDFLVVNRSGKAGGQAVTLEDMAKVRLVPNFVIPFRPKQLNGPGPARRGAFTYSVAALAAEISGRSPERKVWWRLAR
jgi:pilus assembly protein CpaE